MMNVTVQTLAADRCTFCLLSKKKEQLSQSRPCLLCPRNADCTVFIIFAFLRMRRLRWQRTQHETSRVVRAVPPFPSIRMEKTQPIKRRVMEGSQRHDRKKKNGKTKLVAAYKHVAIRTARECVTHSSVLLQQHPIILFYFPFSSLARFAITAPFFVCVRFIAYYTCR